MTRSSAQPSIALSLFLALTACATQTQMRESGPVYSKTVDMTVVEARDCITDHWVGGPYGRSVTPYREGYRISNSGGHIYSYVEVQPSDGGAEISVYGTITNLTVAIAKRCTGEE